MPKRSGAYQDLEDIFRAGVKRVNPKALIVAGLRVKGNRLIVKSEFDSLTLELNDFDRIIVLGTGKATASMAAGLEEVLGERIDGGVIVVKYGHTETLSRIRSIEAGHPIPDEQGVRGAEAVEELARRADERTLVLNLISGGGSALLPAPFRAGEGLGRIAITLEEKQSTTQALLACGAAIQEINCIRKHISRLKGGGLAALLHPARSVNLILSDVVGDRLDTIASGLCVPDETTYAQALVIVDKYGLGDQLPPQILELLHRGADGEIAETPKPGDPVFSGVDNVLLGTNYTALSAASRKAADLGYTPVMLSSRIVGEAREVAKVLAAIVLDMRSRDLLARRPACLLCGGETTVTIRGRGLGGRNQELALSFLQEIGDAGTGAQDIFFLSAATDGNDGPTDAAGAFASLEIAEKVRKRNLSITESLENNDSYRFFESIGSLFKTGPTNTNTCDLQICLIF